MRPFELERHMLLEQYNLSRLVDRIAKAGYVDRRASEGDGRGQTIFITAAGKGPATAHVERVRRSHPKRDRR